MASDPEHPVTTRRSGYRYVFTGKHHGGGLRGEDAQWRSPPSREEEFAVFDRADLHEIDDDGWLYGVWPEAGELHDLGTWGQQVAEFPATRAGVPWHGYPVWAVNQDAPENRASEKMRPAKSVFVKLEQAGLITARQRKRLWKGDHA